MNPTSSRAHGHSDRPFRSLGVCVLAVSDTRDLQSDESGAWLADTLAGAGHLLIERDLVRDEVEQIRERVATWAEDERVQAIVVTGGTGPFARDVTPEALEPLFDKHLPGFGELFRMLSWEEIGTAAIESRAVAGVIRGTLVFAIPGSRGACRTALEKLILPQLDSRTRPCSLGGMIDRL
ncbi:MAG: molybdenum cofactor biosynthesis protein [Planctomycetota bacterium]|nr:MAG: molybdenum cofactor biosynthesis protein [Planctomycetota bacterium]